MDDLAHEVNLSGSRLRQLVKADTGLTAKQLIKRVRLFKAKSLLEQTFLTVKEVQNEVGYPDRSHFSREFTQLFAAPPSQYRRISRQLEISATKLTP